MGIHLEHIGQRVGEEEKGKEKARSGLENSPLILLSKLCCRAGAIPLPAWYYTFIFCLFFKHQGLLGIPQIVLSAAADA